MPMYNDEKIVSQWNWKNFAKIIIIIIVLLYVIRAFYSTYTANSIIGIASNIVPTQEAHVKKLNEEGRAEVKKIQDEMIQGANAIEENASHLVGKLASFEKEFTESLEAEYAKIRERHRKQYIREFLDSHFHYYDVTLYEADRKKFMDSWHYSLPDYVQYDELRKTALKCHIARHNHYESLNYKNMVAQLKTEHQEKRIRSLQKPNYWKWPLTKDQLETIYLHPIPVFDVITLQGQCIDV